MFVAIGSSGSKIIGLLMMPFYTRWLSPTDFGTADILFVYVTLLINVVTCNISEAVFVFPHSAEKEEKKVYFTSGLAFHVLCLLLTMIAFCGVRLLFENCLNDIFVKYIWYIAFLLIVNSVQIYVQQFTRALHRMDIYSLTGLVSSTVIVVSAFLLIPSYGVEGYVVSMAVGHFFAFVYAFLASKAYSYISYKSFNMDRLKEMLCYSIPLIPNVMVWWLISSLNRPIMEKYVGLAGIGFFAVANKFPSIVNMVFGFFQQAWIVTVLDEFKKPGFGKYYNQMLNVIVLIQITLIFFLIYASPLLIRIFAAPKFYMAWQYIPILSLAVFFTNILAYTGTVFSATRQSKYYFYSSAIGAVIAVVLNLILIPMWGIWGACLTVLLSHLSAAISRILFSSKVVKIDRIGVYLAMLFLFAAAYIFSLLQGNLLITLIIGATCYALILWLNRSVLWVAFSIILKKRNNG